MGAPTTTEADLQAYVDGRLPEARRREVEHWLAARPDVAERVAAYRQIGEALRVTYGELVDDEVPTRLDRVLQARRRRSFARLAGALAAFLGAVGAWYLHDWPAATDLIHGPAAAMVRDAAIAHAVYAPEVRHPVEVDAEEKAHLLGWLSRRLGMKVEAPDLAAARMTLVGGRLLPGKTRPAAMLMYEAPDGRRATVHWAPDTTRAHETELLYAEENRIRVFYWIDRECGYAVASADLTKEELSRIARMSHEQLER